jgi:hypothetical protein
MIHATGYSNHASADTTYTKLLTPETPYYTNIEVAIANTFATNVALLSKLAGLTCGEPCHVKALPICFSISANAPLCRPVYSVIQIPVIIYATYQ